MLLYHRKLSLFVLMRKIQFLHNTSILQKEEINKLYILNYSTAFSNILEWYGWEQ
jgi:hypothetical protein